MFIANCIEKTKIKKKRPGMAHFLKKNVWPWLRAVPTNWVSFYYLKIIKRSAYLGWCVASEQIVYGCGSVKNGQFKRTDLKLKLYFCVFQKGELQNKNVGMKFVLFKLIYETNSCYWFRLHRWRRQHQRRQDDLHFLNRFRYNCEQKVPIPTLLSVNKLFWTLSCYKNVPSKSIINKLWYC